MSSKTISPKAWHTLTYEAIAEQMVVDPKRGLNKAEVEQRLRQYGPNVLSKAKKEPLWHAFLRQYKNYILIVLTVAAVASLLIGDVTTGVALFILTFFNASQGLQQERRAEKGIAAINKLMQDKALVRRDGQVVEIVSEEIVPGDICLLEAGDRIPADGRLLIAASLEVDEAVLTGESTPVLKDTASIEKVDTPLGDRLNMGYMNCNVTRGRGELLVTTTGMKTEVGHIAEMLHSIKEEKSPLTKQVDGLTLIITIMAVISLVLIVVMGFSYGYSFSDLFVLGITLAIAAIPTGLPILVTSILTIGSMEMVKRGAIIKRLPLVETMGSISAICTDKTGTLTLNQMTARELVIAGHKYSVTGEGYDSQGKILHTAGVGDINLDPILIPMVLCSDAVIKEGELVGDPTEGALAVLAQKGGIMVDETRKQFPRIAEVPFDSTYKLMATFHKMNNAHEEPQIRCYVKGALDVLISRSVTFRGSDGLAKPLDEKSCLQAFEFNERLASQGMRIIAVAERTLDPETFDSESNLLDEVNNLTLLGMVGIVDPPRPEVKPAIGKCLSAGIQVRMVTGDHPATATAIADELGIKGQTITGAEFSQMSDQEVINKVDDIGVIARVAPEDKVRLVKLLKEKNNIVAMTGDGVNDAPALKMADIGIAMGITGTDVSKESAVIF
jgi:Ca2+-transporting ATPase